MPASTELNEASLKTDGAARGAAVRHDLRKTVVLGAGTMGAQVAAHLVAMGNDVTLLDIVPKGLGEAEDRSRLARKAVAGLPKLRPSPLHLAEHAARIRTGNFEDDWEALENADWIFEAVIEDLEIKKGLLSRVAAAAPERAIVTTNTSGLGIAAMSAHLPVEFRRRFFGTHFFNPPRYLKLLETIPGPDTDLELMAGVERFLEEVVGKGVVRCKDTPNFIGNRVGLYAMALTLRTMVDLDMTIEEVDTLTGPAIGRPKSATFRTADIAGVDVVAKVAQNLYAGAPDDPERETFVLPDFVAQMLERGWLGAKTDGGFYKKEGPEIRTLDWKTLEYRDRIKAKFPAVDAGRSLEDGGERIRLILKGKDKAASFLWRVLSSSCLYAASLVPEISDDVVSVDHAMEWGYAWGKGPFGLLDALGVKEVAERARGEGRTIPPLVESLLASGRTSFYETKDGKATVFGPIGVQPVPERPGVVSLAAVKAAGGLRRKNAGASLVDLGDGCGLVEFHSKMNALGADAISMLASAVKEARTNFDALVIGNQGEHFSAGANLMLVLLAAQEEEWDELDLTIRQFQGANMAIKYADVPVVVAPFGFTLAGGCEICLHGHRVRASAETYMGLVEVGVGLVPAAGGTKEMALRAHDRCADVKDADPFPFVRRAFETIGMAKVATSGTEALGMFLTPADSLSPNPDRLVHDAKRVALGTARAGYRAGRPRTDVPALGRPALATFKSAIFNLREGNQISEHDALIGTKIATILCGGDRAPGVASEQDFLDLEREAFLSLVGTRKTQERIQHMLKAGKPLRN
jgi:3-hydroxyacyl-CoA dehydrogenase